MANMTDNTAGLQEILGLAQGLPTGGSGTDISLGVTGAVVGQIVRVTAVDENGAPLAWEAMDLPAGSAPVIGENGHWYIDGVDTGVVAEGQDGLPGADGVTPHIGANRHWYIGATDTGILAEGQDGTTPHVGSNGHWWVGTVDTGVKAQGDKGDPGDNGLSPHVGSNGHWWIGSTDTGVTAQGAKGDPGDDGVSITHSWIGTTLRITSKSGTSSKDLGLKYSYGTDDLVDGVSSLSSGMLYFVY